MSDWTIAPSGHLERTFRFPDFARALAFANEVGRLAEAANHHPDLHVAWGRCRVELWTHTTGAVSELDYALAAEIDRLGT